MYKRHNKRLMSATTKPISRRDFLRFTGIGVASTVLPAIHNHSAFAKVYNSPIAERARLQGGNILRVAFEAPITLDPATHSTDSEVALANAIYDYLVDVSPTSEILPRLARTWTTSEDGLEYRFELAEGVKFHDGSDFTANDVIWTFNRLRNPDISGASDLLGAIDDIQADGDLTVVFTLSQPSPDFLYNLSDNRALILKADTEDPTNFNGTGPFKMEDYRPDDRAILTRNDDYFDGAPAIEGLNFIYFGDANASSNALQDGSVDILLRMPTLVFESLVATDEFTTIDVPTNGYNNIRLRQDRGVGSNPDVMKAFRLAVDRRAIFELISFGYGAEGKDSPIGPLYGAYFDEELTLPERDVDAAKELLAGAGYPDGLDIDLFVPNSGDRPDLAVAIRDQLADAGIRVSVQQRDEGVYYSEEPDNWLDADFGITGWGSRPTPQQYLELSLKTGAIWNESHFSDAELDELIDTAGTSLDDEERITAYKEIQRVLAERGPLIIPYFFPQFGVFNPSVSGVEVHPFAGRTNFSKAKLD